ncbi:MAG: hypothetical protein K6V36_14810 [Anaerolineae bacterium]|nr:hypothetical protein [Anaerolineae bacterium]
MADETPATGQDEESLEGELPLVRLAPGERFYKFYIVSEPGVPPGQRVEHRILSKEHADGSLEMISYNAWIANGHSEKSDVIRVPSLSKAQFDQLVARVRTKTDVPPEAIREIDLSRCGSVEEQLRVLSRLT